MLIDLRMQKRIVAALSTLLFLLIAGGGIYFGANFLFFQKNGNDSVDGHDSLRPKSLQILTSGYFMAKEGVYDAFVLIRNSNADVGASSIEYDLVFKNDAGETMGAVGGESFIMPSMDSYIINQAISLAVQPGEMVVMIKSVKWQELASFNLGRIDIKNIDLSRNINKGSTIFSGTVINNSPFNLQNIKIQSAFFDKNGKFVAIGQTSVQTMLRKEERTFRITWPNVLPSDLLVEAAAITNLFDNSNFINEFGGLREFQEYY